MLTPRAQEVFVKGHETLTHEAQVVGFNGGACRLAHLRALYGIE
jgi:hypothetical protein